MKVLYIYIYIHLSWYSYSDYIFYRLDEKEHVPKVKLKRAK